MEFIAGIIFTLVAGFIGNRFYLAYKRKKERAEYIPPAGSGLDRPIDHRTPFQKQQDL